MAKGYQRYIKFAYPISTYFPDSLSAIAAEKNGEKALRREYTRLRDVARKRLIRMGKTEYKRTKFYKKWIQEIPKLKELKTTSDLTHALSDVARFLTSAIGSIPGMEEYRRREVESLQESGFKFVTEANFFDFTDFMDKLEDEGGKNFYPSNTMDFLRQTLEKGANWEEIEAHFDKYKEDIIKNNEIPPWTPEKK